jgi:hypothetical protein
MPRARNSLYSGERRNADLDGASWSRICQQVERMNDSSAQRFALRLKPAIGRRDHRVSARPAQGGDRYRARPLGQAKLSALAVDG